MFIKKIAAFILAFSVLLGTVPAVSAADAPKLYIDNELIELEHPCAVEEGDRVYIPFEEVFFKMGVYMSWDDNLKCYTGSGNNGEIRIETDKITAMVDSVNIELPYPTKTINGTPMVPLYFVEDALKTDPGVYDAATNSIYIKFPDINDKYDGINAAKMINYEKLEKQLPAGDEMWMDEYYNQLVSENGANYIKHEVVDVEGMSFDKAIRIETLPYIDGMIPNKSYDIQAYVTTKSGDFKAGETGLLTFWARATKITDESNYARFKATWEQSDNYQKAVDQEINIGSEWKKYYFPLYSGFYTLYSGNSRFTFPVGYKPQVIEIADIHIRNFHDTVPLEVIKPSAIQQTDYHGIEEDAVWRKEAYRRIEKYRKNDMAVYVTDEDGKPVEGAKVNFNMTDHEFNWGVEICTSEINRADPESRAGKIRIDTLNNDFNMVLDGLEMKESSNDYITSVNMYKYLYENGIRMRGHALTWDEQKVNKMPNYDTATYEEKYNYLLQEVAKECWLFRGMCSSWDVLNEPYASNVFRYRYGTQVYSDAFKLAKAIDPTCSLFLNDTSMGSKVSLAQETVATKLKPLVRNMIDNERAPIDGLGLQGHGGTYNYPQMFYDDLDILSKEVDEVAVTEYDFKSEDLSREMEHMRDRVIATFSHPKATTFIMWGYASNMHWVSNAPMYDMLWNKKAPYYEWKRLMDEEFSTHETVETDKDGRAFLRGFRGDYDITVTVDGKNPLSGKTRFKLVNSDNIERDNRIDVKIQNGKMTFSHANTPEVYAKHNVLHRSGQEAYADYLAHTDSRVPIGIYKHTDNEGKSTRNTNDGLVNTFWYGNGDGAYMDYELVEKAEKGDITVTFRAPKNEVYKYKVLKSEDGKAWNEIYSGSSDVKTTVPFENAMFIRVMSDGNEYMGISEVALNAEKKKVK